MSWSASLLEKPSVEIVNRAPNRRSWPSVRLRKKWIPLSTHLSSLKLLETEKILISIVASVLFINPIAALVGLVCLIYPLALNIGMNLRKIREISSTCLCNVFLTGAVISWEFNPNLNFFLTLSIASISCILTVRFLEHLRWFFGLPVLISPALIVLNLLTVLKPGTMPSNFKLDSIIHGHGLIFLTLLWTIYSPLSALIFGFGIAISLPLLAMTSMFTVIVSAFLFFVIMIAANLPSISSMIWGCIAVIFSSYVLQNHFIQAASSIELLSLLLLINLTAALCLYGYRLSTKLDNYYAWYLRPEDRLEFLRTYWSRFRIGEARIYCPFSGRWSVYQGFDGPWTHQGHWRHSLDFVIQNAQGKTFGSNGLNLDDYYAFGQPILAPVSGYVVGLTDHFADNVIGTVDNQNRWGNHLVIRDAYGAHVVIAHMKHQSISCKLYQYVDAGQDIGLCGNSGYSPEPHIHIHVQASPYVGSTTLPFHVMNFIRESQAGHRFESHATPRQGEFIINPMVNENLARTMSFVIGDKFSITGHNNYEIAPLEVTNNLDPYTGTMYFSSGNARLYHARYGVNFCFTYYAGPKNHPLFDLMMALPRLPLVFNVICQFSDLNQNEFGPIQKYMNYTKQMFNLKSEFAQGTYVFDAKKMLVTGSLPSAKRPITSSCKVDPLDGICDFTVGDRSYSMARSNRQIAFIDNNPHNIIELRKYK